MLCRVLDSISVFNNRLNYYLLDAKISLLWKILWLLFLGCMSLIDSIVGTSWFLNTFTCLIQTKTYRLNIYFYMTLPFYITYTNYKLMYDFCKLACILLKREIKKKKKKKIQTCWSLSNPSALISTGFFFKITPIFKQFC